MRFSKNLILLVFFLLSLNTSFASNEVNPSCFDLLSSLVTKTVQDMNIDIQYKEVAAQIESAMSADKSVENKLSPLMLAMTKLKVAKGLSADDIVSFKYRIPTHIRMLDVFSDDDKKVRFVFEGYVKVMDENGDDFGKLRVAVETKVSTDENGKRTYDSSLLNITILKDNVKKNEVENGRGFPIDKLYDVAQSAFYKVSDSEKKNLISAFENLGVEPKLLNNGFDIKENDISHVSIVKMTMDSKKAPLMTIEIEYNVYDSFGESIGKAKFDIELSRTTFGSSQEIESYNIENIKFKSVR